jgi:hypothetical protein
LKRIYYIGNIILPLIKCFLILIIFGYYLPLLIDYFLFYIMRSNYYDNSIFVNYIVDKNNKIIYNYMYIVKLILNQ